MKKLSKSLLANLVATQRKEKHMTQQDLADITGINRSMISRLEKEDFIPSIPQLEQLGETLGFEPQTLFVETSNNKLPSPSPLNIAVAWTGYVGLSIATLLAQHNHVTAVDIISEKVELTIVETDPAIKGAPSNQTKDAKTETGLTLRVPQFIEQGEKIVVFSADGKYAGRA